MIPKWLQSDSKNESKIIQKSCYFRFCRVVSPPSAAEDHELDREGFPILGSNVYGIPKPSDPVLINPQPGCFGRGPQALKSKSGYFGLQTDSLVTYGRY